VTLLILLCIHAVLYDVLHAAACRRTRNFFLRAHPRCSPVAMLDQGLDTKQINPASAACDMKKAVRESKPPRSLLSA
jgi:hypothetical protein